MNLPGFNAEKSLRRTRGVYRGSTLTSGRVPGWVESAGGLRETAGAVSDAAPLPAFLEGDFGPVGGALRQQGPGAGPGNPLIGMGGCQRLVHYSCINGCAGGFCCLDVARGPYSCQRMCRKKYWPNC